MSDVNTLNNQIKQQLKELGGTVSLFISFFETGESIEINSDQQLWAASVIKLPIACTFYKALSNNKLTLETRQKINPENRVEGSGILKLLSSDDTFTNKDLVTLMLAVSDNSATNELVDLIGWESVEKLMQDLGLSNTTFRHKMMIKAGRGPNLTTASDIGKLLKLLFEDKLSYSNEIIGILKMQQDRRYIPLLLPNDLEIAHKTGGLEKAMHDVGIIYSASPFSFVFLSDDQEDKQKTNKVLSNCALLAYQYSCSSNNHLA